MTERVTLPLDDDNLPTAAAVYLAVLAFPGPTRKDYKWRDDFLDAIVAAFKQPRINARRIAAIDRVSKRLEERMKAVDIARPVMAATGTRRMRILLRIREGKAKPFKPSIYRMAFERKHGDYGNLLGRAWKRSLPVLHLALAFDNHAPKGKTVLALIRNPEWVRLTVKASRVFGAAIRRDIPTAGDLIEIVATRD